jgi:hypothetical protein
MKTEQDLNASILELTMKINKVRPELSKYLSEMTETIPNKNDTKITLKDLQEYHDSLKVILLKYEQEHDPNFVIKIK